MDNIIINEFYNQLQDCKINKIQLTYIKSVLSSLSSCDIQIFSDLLQFYLDNNMSLKGIANIYEELTKQTLRQQIRFQTEKQYIHSKLDEVLNSVYLNKHYMDNYITGISISTFLLKSRIGIWQWLLKRATIINGKNYLEIGPGEGLFFFEMLRTNHYEKYTGVDLSPISVKRAQNYIQYNCNKNEINPNYLIKILNILDYNSSEKFDLIVMSEVLEHTENPSAVLKKIHELCNINSHIFITTAINAPEEDHLFLFQHKDVVFNLVESCGFQVLEYLCLPEANISLETAEEKNYACDIAIHLQIKK